MIMVHRTVRVEDTLAVSLAIYYRSVLNVHYLVHIFSLDVLSIPVLYTRHLDIYTDGGGSRRRQRLVLRVGHV
jgi:hypothetical protein